MMFNVGKVIRPWQQVMRVARADEGNALAVGSKL